LSSTRRRATPHGNVTLPRKPCPSLVVLLCVLMCLGGAPARAEYAQEPDYWLRLNVPAFEVTLLKGDSPVKTYPVAVGKSWSQTPLGSFTIVYKATHPWWIPPDGGRIVPPGPQNPLGTRWMGLSKPYYGLHGTNAPSSIGHAISLGCVRMMPADAEEVYDLVSVGSRVEIVYELVSLDSTPDGCVIHVFADVYGKGTPAREGITALLRGCGFDATAIEDVIPQVIRELEQPTGFAIRTAVMAGATAATKAGAVLPPNLLSAATGDQGLVPASDTKLSLTVLINAQALAEPAVLVMLCENVTPGSLESQDEFASTLWLDAKEACSIAGVELTIRDDLAYIDGLATAVKQNGERIFISLLRFVVASGGSYRREGSLVHVSVPR